MNNESMANANVFVKKLHFKTQLKITLQSSWIFLLFVFKDEKCNTPGVLWKCNLAAHPLMDCVNLSQTHGAVLLICNKA